MQYGVVDVLSGLRHYEIWLTLAWSEIRQRYRRSTLGPFWLTLSMAITIAGMGPLYGRLFGQDISNYISFLTVGMVTWALISGIVTDASAAFIGAEGYIKEFNLPLSVYILRAVARNLIVLAHNLVVLIFVLVVFPPPSLGWTLLLFPLAIIAIAVNGVAVGLLLGVLCTRFRDITQIVASVLQIAFFLTPIMWRPAMLGKNAWVLDFNPLYYFVEAVRAPLLGETIRISVWLGIGVCTLLTAFAALTIFGRYRSRIAYWL